MPLLCCHHLISHVHRTYDYSGSFGVLWVHMAWYKKIVLKKKFIHLFIVHHILTKSYFNVYVIAQQLKSSGSAQPADDWDELDKICWHFKINISFPSNIKPSELRSQRAKVPRDGVYSLISIRCGWPWTSPFFNCSAFSCSFFLCVYYFPFITYIIRS